MRKTLVVFIRVSSQYELQNIYLDVQKQFLEVMGRLAELDPENNPENFLRSLVGRLMVLNPLQEGLIEGYTALIDIEEDIKE